MCKFKIKDIFKLIALFFLIAGFTSCKKDFRNTLDPVLPPAPHDSVTRLSQLIFIDTRASVTDTTGYIDYLYDGLQRVTSVKRYEYINDTPLLKTVSVYYYNGNDSMAFKKTGTSTDTLNSFPDTTFYSYDSLERLIKDSTVSSKAVKVNQYNYTDTVIKALGSIISFTAPLDTFMNVYSGFIDSIGNVTVTHTSTYTNEFFIDSFIYDNRLNPFFQLNIRSTYRPVPGYSFYLYDNYLQKNNATVVNEETFPSSGTKFTTTYTYTYNASGLPDTVNISDENGPTDEPRIAFLYKKI